MEAFLKTCFLTTIVWSGSPRFIQARSLCNRHLLETEGAIEPGKAHIHIKTHHHHSEEELERFKSTFNGIYSDKKWGEGGRGSGSGSTLAVTELTRAVLRVVATNYSIQTMIDAPCGEALKVTPL